MKLGDQFEVRGDKVIDNSGSMEWLHKTPVDEVAANTKALNKNVKSPAPTEKQTKVITALENLPPNYRDSIRVILEEVTGESYPQPTNFPVLDSLVLLTSGQAVGFIALCRKSRDKDHVKVLCSLNGGALYFSSPSCDRSFTWEYLDDAMLDKVVSWYK